MEFPRQKTTARGHPDTTRCPNGRRAAPSCADNDYDYYGDNDDVVVVVVDGVDREFGSYNSATMAETESEDYY